MKKTKRYQYIGRNGVLITPILIDGAAKIDMFCLEADERKILTDGEQKLYTIIVYADEVDNWTEIEDNPKGQI